MILNCKCDYTRFKKHRSRYAYVPHNFSLLIIISFWFQFRPMVPLPFHTDPTFLITECDLLENIKLHTSLWNCNEMLVRILNQLVMEIIRRIFDISFQNDSLIYYFNEIAFLLASKFPYEIGLIFSDRCSLLVR